MRKRAMGIRVNHEKKSARVRVHHDRKSDGARVCLEKEQGRENSP